MGSSQRDGRALAWTPLIGEFRDKVLQMTGRRFVDYEAMNRWSIDAPEEFWQAIWTFDGIQSYSGVSNCLESAQMPGARWFVGARVNYTRQVLRHVERAHQAGHPALIAEDECGLREVVDWPSLRSAVASFALSLRALGIGKGDRVAAYLPNRPEAIVSFLACASIGAIWAVCAPDTGVPAILDRFRQIEPAVLIATDGVFYAGKAVDRVGIVQQLRDALPSARALVLVRSGHSVTELTGALDFKAMSATKGPDVDAFEPDWLPFEHPLWIVYSSGTTGKPKALVHGHGGILLGSAAGRIHSDLGASYDARTPGERFHWFSSTGWMMWNSQVGGLLSGTTICVFDGSPMGSRTRPDWALLGASWQGVELHFSALGRNSTHSVRKLRLILLRSAICHSCAPWAARLRRSLLRYRKPFPNDWLRREAPEFGGSTLRTSGGYRKSSSSTYQGTMTNQPSARRTSGIAWYSAQTDDAASRHSDWAVLFQDLLAALSRIVAGGGQLRDHLHLRFSQRIELAGQRVARSSFEAASVRL